MCITWNTWKAIAGFSTDGLISNFLFSIICNLFSIDEFPVQNPEEEPGWSNYENEREVQEEVKQETARVEQQYTVPTPR